MTNEVTRKSRVWVDKTINLESGQEWDSQVMHIKKGSLVSVDLLSTERVYFRISKYDEYKIETKNGKLAYEFPFGSDEKIIDDAIKIDSDADYILIMRLSVFNGFSRVKLKVEVIDPPS